MQEIAVVQRSEIQALCMRKALIENLQSFCDTFVIGV